MLGHSIHLLGFFLILGFSLPKSLINSIVIPFYNKNTRSYIFKQILIGLFKQASFMYLDVVSLRIFLFNPDLFVPGFCCFLCHPWDISMEACGVFGSRPMVMTSIRRSPCSPTPRTRKTKQSRFLTFILKHAT